MAESKSDEKKATKELEVALGKAYFSYAFKKSNPTSTSEQRSEGWRSQKKEYIAIAGGILRQLSKNGYLITRTK